MTAIIARMAGIFKMVASEPGASDEQVNMLIEFFRRVGRTVPIDYLEMLREVTDLEILVGDTGCIRFWSPDGVVEMNEAHDFQAYIPTGVAIGDDEGGATYVLMD